MAFDDIPEGRDPLIVRANQLIGDAAQDGLIGNSKSPSVRLAEKSLLSSLTAVNCSIAQIHKLRKDSLMAEAAFSDARAEIEVIFDQHPNLLLATADMGD